MKKNFLIAIGLSALPLLALGDPLYCVTNNTTIELTGQLGLFGACLNFDVPTGANNVVCKKIPFACQLTLSEPAAVLAKSTTQTICSKGSVDTTGPIAVVVTSSCTWSTNEKNK